MSISKKLKNDMESARKNKHDNVLKTMKRRVKNMTSQSYSG